MGRTDLVQENDTLFADRSTKFGFTFEPQLRKIHQ